MSRNPGRPVAARSRISLPLNSGYTALVLAQRGVALAPTSVARQRHAAVEIGGDRYRQRAIGRRIARAIDGGAIALRHVRLGKTAGAIFGRLVGDLFAGGGPRTVMGGAGAGQAALIAAF